MKKLPIGIQSFEVMRTQGYLYVDKTRDIHRLVDEGMFYFLARPRRFGKSLLVSTLQCLFQGRRNLFRGLWIAEKGNWEWQEHPVLVVDFSGIAHDTPEYLQQSLQEFLTNTAQEAGIVLYSSLLVSMFRELILGLHKKTGASVAILIDEYDKPLVDHLGRGEQGLSVARANRDILRSFFGVLKDVAVSAVLRFVFLTGVSRFSRVSIFSQLNNLNDISMHDAYATMLGYTQREMDACFAGHRRRLAAKMGRSEDEIREALARQYDGYRFAERPARVYNPFSVLQAFDHQRLGNYWFESGTPRFLVDLIRQQGYEPPRLEGLQVSRSVFTAFDIDHLVPEALLFQTGYLTITDVQEGIYTLDYPNHEVKTAFTELLLLSTEGLKPTVSSHVLRLAQHLEREDLAAFFEAMKAIFAAIPYDISARRDEAYFHALFYLMISASGGAAQSSVLTARGRIDLVVDFPDKVYLIEFKCNQSARTAIRQIRDRGYAERYRQSGKKVILLGINFDTEARNVGEWEQEILEDPVHRL